MTSTTTTTAPLPETESPRPGPVASGAVRLTPAEAAVKARDFADRSGEWLHRVRLSSDGRWYERVHSDDEHEVWLISWLPGQSTGLHDHGGASGAFTVVLGTLEEHGVSAARVLGGGESRQFGPGHVHDVRNASTAPAVSVHVYSPPLATMRRYDLDADGRLVELVTESADDW